MRKALGLIQTYGAVNAAVQAIEKSVRSGRRHICIREETSSDGRSGGKIIPEVLQAENFGLEDAAGAEGCGRRVSVVFVVHRYFPDSCGGTEQFARNLALEMKKRNHNVVVCAYSEDESHRYTCRSGGILWREGKPDGIPVLYFRRERPRSNLIKDIESEGRDYADFVRALRERFKPDVFHFTHLSRVSGLAQYCRQQRIPYIVTITDFFALCHYSVYMRRDGHLCGGSRGGRMCMEACKCRTACLEGRYERSIKILSSALAVTAPSRFVADIFKREMPGLGIRVVPHSVKTISCAVNSASGEEIGRFLYVGSLTPEKGIRTLLKAFRGMPESCSLKIYGSGRQGYVKKLRKAAAGDGRIVFAGTAGHETIEHAYLDADCVVIPSEVPETYCMVLHEALASGRFVVASRIGAIPEAVAEGRSGLLFEPGNAGDLLEKMLDSLNLKNTELRDLDPLSEIRTYLGIYGRICQGESSRNAYTSGEEGTAV